MGGVMKRILVPVDGSIGANKAAKFAAELAQGMSAQIVLIYVYDAPGVAILGLAALTPEDIKAVQQAIASQSFEKAKAAMQAPNVDIKTEVIIGYPSKEIVAYAKERAVDLIVMGSRGQSEIQGLLMGSVSQFVMHHATCPVTIVH